MAPHSSTLAWKLPWTEEPGGLWSMGSQRVGHDWATLLSLFTFMHWRRKWHHTPVFLPGTGEPGGLPSVGSHRVGHDWSDLAAAAGWIYLAEPPEPVTQAFVHRHVSSVCDFPGGPVAKTALSRQEPQSPSLVGKLRPHLTKWSKKLKSLYCEQSILFFLH